MSKILSNAIFQWRTYRVAVFLAFRYIARTSKWQTLLVIFVMMLTFLNLVAINGVLVGLIDGALKDYNSYYTGDLFISQLPEKDSIEHAGSVRAILKRNEDVVAFSERIIANGVLKANFQRIVSQPNKSPDSTGVTIAGIDINNENLVTDLEKKMAEGEFLTEGDDNGIVIGQLLIERYFPSEIGLGTVSNVYTGDKVRLTIGDIERTFTVRGILATKADATDHRVFILNTELKEMLNMRGSLVADEFAVRVKDGVDPKVVQRSILSYGVGSHALVRTTGESIGEFLDEIRDTFKIIGNIIGGISVIAASITIFIIVFITAITRRKFIGILKAIGVSGSAIELSYVMLSMFYSFVGISIGVAILYLFLLPHFTQNPIDFPFSDGILSVSPFDTISRSVTLILTTVIAGYVPARMIVKKNTLDSILGR